MKVYGPLEKAQLEVLSAEPSSAPNGFVYFDSTIGAARVKTALGWADMSTPESALLADRNYITNGDFLVHQIASASMSMPASTTPIAISDSWSARSVAKGGAGTFTRYASSASDRGRYYLEFVTTQQFSGSFGTPPSYISTFIPPTTAEDFNWKAASALSAKKTVTLSFWVKSNAAPLRLVGSVRSSGTTSASAAYIFGYSITSANTWEYITITIPPPDVAVDFTKGVFIIFNLTSGFGAQFVAPSSALGTWGSSTSIFHIDTYDFIASSVGNGIAFSQIQLDIGDTATPFEELTFEKEYGRCRRYFTKTYDYQTGLNAATSVGAVQVVDPLTNGAIPVFYDVKMHEGAKIGTIYSPITGTGQVYSTTTSANIGGSITNLTGTSSATVNLGTATTTGQTKQFHYRVFVYGE